MVFGNTSGICSRVSTMIVRSVTLRGGMVAYFLSGSGGSSISSVLSVFALKGG